MEPGMRVRIKKETGIAGVKIGAAATVLFYFPNEIYPVQLELDEPDTDGHSVYRVRLADIGLLEEPPILVTEPEEDWLSSDLSLFEFS